MFAAAETPGFAAAGPGEPALAAAVGVPDGECAAGAEPRAAAGADPAADITEAKGLAPPEPGDICQPCPPFKAGRGAAAEAEAPPPA